MNIVCVCHACRSTRDEVARVVREQTVRDADYHDVALTSVHMAYTETQA